MNQTFPSTFPLNGSDYFQVFLDGHHRKYGNVGNVSRLVLLLDSEPKMDQLEQKLQSTPHLVWMHSLRLRTSSFFRIPAWKSFPNEIKIHHHAKQVSQIADLKELINRDIDPKKEPPIQFDIVKLDNNWGFVLSWNHILMDARGAEILLSQIELDSSITFFASDNFPDEAWKMRIKEINVVKNFLVPRVSAGLSLLQSKKTRVTNGFRIINFSKDETDRIDLETAQYKVGIATSSFYLAAVQSAFRTVSELSDKPSWIPVPQDQRRKGQLGPVMSNQVSFLFIPFNLR